jgi:hypothetical protein
MRALVRGKKISLEGERDKIFSFIEVDFERAYSLCNESEDRENVICLTTTDTIASHHPIEVSY